MNIMPVHFTVLESMKIRMHINLYGALIIGSPASSGKLTLWLLVAGVNSNKFDVVANRRAR
jgi:hypothetical protein